MRSIFSAAARRRDAGSTNGLWHELEKGLGLPERPPQQPTHLVARQRTVSITLAGDGFEGTARQIPPFVLEVLGDVFRQFNVYVHKGYLRGHPRGPRPYGWRQFIAASAAFPAYHSSLVHDRNGRVQGDVEGDVDLRVGPEQGWLATRSSNRRDSPPSLAKLPASYGGHPSPEPERRVEAPPGFEPGMEVLQT